jgi:serine/threonine protein kinase
MKKISINNNHTIYKFKLNEKIYESTNSLIYKGVIKENNESIILKILKENYPSPSELVHYQQEYEITRSLNADNIIKTYGLQRHEHSLVILLEYFGGQSLQLLMLQNNFSLEKKTQHWN